MYEYKKFCNILNIYKIILFYFNLTYGSGDLLLLHKQDSYYHL